LAQSLVAQGQQTGTTHPLLQHKLNNRHVKGRSNFVAKFCVAKFFVAKIFAAKIFVAKIAIAKIFVAKIFVVEIFSC